VISTTVRADIRFIRHRKPNSRLQSVKNSRAFSNQPV
jgi:hypothetical protein